jgi:hypothetical protein
LGITGYVDARARRAYAESRPVVLTREEATAEHHVDDGIAVTARNVHAGGHAVGGVPLDRDTVRGVLPAQAKYPGNGPGT